MRRTILISITLLTTRSTRSNPSGSIKAPPLTPCSRIWLLNWAATIARRKRRPPNEAGAFPAFHMTTSAQLKPETAPRVALFGLGLMGAGMARRVLGAGFPLTIYNRTPGKATALVAAGAQLAATPREAAARADVIISMVADDAASRAVWLGENGALAGAARGAVLIEASTLTPGWIAELGQAAAQRGCELLDAPVTGSKIHAASGELSFLVGGSAAGLEKARPVLSVMSKAIVHVGLGGSGALLKLINNFLC